MWEWCEESWCAWDDVKSYEPSVPPNLQRNRFEMSKQCTNDIPHLPTIIEGFPIIRSKCVRAYTHTHTHIQQHFIIILLPLLLQGTHM
jgi:hypothetical protein